MNIHLPAILMFTRGTRFWHTAISENSIDITGDQFVAPWSEVFLRQRNSLPSTGAFVKAMEWTGGPHQYGSVSKPCTPVVHIKIAGIYGCSSP